MKDYFLYCPLKKLRQFLFLSDVLGIYSLNVKSIIGLHACNK